MKGLITFTFHPSIHPSFPIYTGTQINRAQREQNIPFSLLFSSGKKLRRSETSWSIISPSWPVTCYTSSGHSYQSLQAESSLCGGEASPQQTSPTQMTLSPSFYGRIVQPLCKRSIQFHQTHSNTVSLICRRVIVSMGNWYVFSSTACRLLTWIPLLQTIHFSTHIWKVLWWWNNVWTYVMFIPSLIFFTTISYG